MKLNAIFDSLAKIRFVERFEASICLLVNTGATPALDFS
jgi:hypothetical protein